MAVFSYVKRLHIIHVSAQANASAVCANVSM